MIDTAIEMANSAQRKFGSSGRSKVKLDAKKYGCSKMPADGLVLDIGGEDYYREFIKAHLVAMNLPDDMHKIDDDQKYDGILAMHVLEHSPIPFAVLLSCHKALKHGGLIYISVPTERNFYFIQMAEHFTIMPRPMWRKLIEQAGFQVIGDDEGIFNDYKNAIEYRFLCRKG